MLPTHGSSLTSAFLSTYPRPSGRSSCINWRSALAAAIALPVGSILAATCAWYRQSTSPSPILAPENLFARTVPLNKTLGTNLGGWLCLEDWLFSEDQGSSVVPLFGTDGQGQSLPPNAHSPIEKFIGTSTWPSEGLLTKRMNQTVGTQETIAAFQRHRSSFITDQDFLDMASLGIRAVRVPLTWSVFADALAPLSDVYRGANDKTTIVPDPYYVEQAAAVTIPRAWLADQIRMAGAAGLKVVLDLHAFPAGAQDGTYNGIWPLRPQFWQARSRLGPDIPLTKVGLWIVKAFVQWVDEELDDMTRSNIHALQLMNEPAHMNWVPESGRASHPWTGYASESDVLNWVATAASMFRSSRLPDFGVKLFVQLIETAFEDYFTTVPPWFLRTFSAFERATWVVLGRQYYPAFDTNCKGSVGTLPDTGYRCGDSLNESRQVMQHCAQGFIELTNKHFEFPQVSVVEFSLGTANDPSQACTSRELLVSFWKEQLAAFSSGSAEFYFWTWKTSHGSCFDPGWSLQHFAHSSPPRRCAVVAQQARRLGPTH